MNGVAHDFVSDVSIAALIAADALEQAAVAYLSAAVAAVAADVLMFTAIFNVAAIITANPGVAHAVFARRVEAEHADKATFEASIEATTAGGCSSGAEERFLGSQLSSEFCIGSIPK